MSEPKVDIACRACFDARGVIARMDREFARVVRERDDALSRLAAVEARGVPDEALDRMARELLVRHYYKPTAIAGCVADWMRGADEDGLVMRDVSESLPDMRALLRMVLANHLPRAAAQGEDIGGLLAIIREAIGTLLGRPWTSESVDDLRDLARAVKDERDGLRETVERLRTAEQERHSLRTRAERAERERDEARAEVKELSEITATAEIAAAVEAAVEKEREAIALWCSERARDVYDDTIAAAYIRAAHYVRTRAATPAGGGETRKEAAPCPRSAPTTAGEPPSPAGRPGDASADSSAAPTCPTCRCPTCVAIRRDGALLGGCTARAPEAAPPPPAEKAEDVVRVRVVPHVREGRTEDVWFDLLMPNNVETCIFAFDDGSGNERVSARQLAESRAQVLARWLTAHVTRERSAARAEMAEEAAEVCELQSEHFAETHAGEWIDAADRIRALGRDTTKETTDV